MTALRKTGMDDPAHRVAAAIDTLGIDDLRSLGAWEPLAELSSHTELEAIGIDESSVVLNGDHFEAVADLYLMLNYAPYDDENSLSGTVVATIRGRITPDRVDIEDVTVDTTNT